MKPYRKRTKGHWCSGKGNKGDGHERQFAKREIKQLLAEDEENYIQRYHKGKRSKNEKARLEYRVHWYEQMLQTWERQHPESSMLSYFRDSLRRARSDLQKKFPIEEVN